MAEPYDYTFKGLQSPQEAFDQGLKSGNELFKLQQQRIADQKKAAQEAQMQMDMAALSANPTVGGIQQIMAKYPAFSEKFKPLLESLNAQQKENRIRQANSIFMPLIAGDKDLALEQLNTQIEAATNSGDVASQKSLDALKKTLESEKTGALGDSMVTIAMGSFLAEAMGPEQFAKTYEAISEQRRKEAMAPSELKESTAKALLKELELKFAPEKFGAEIGLTAAQTASAKAAARAHDAAAAKSGSEAARARAEASQMAAGVIPVEKRPQAEANFRDEYAKATKTHQEVKASYARVLASEDTAAGDLSLIFNYMKMLDPGSAVREGEFANAQNAGSISQKIQNIYNKALTGERLAPSQRKMFEKQSEKLFDMSSNQEKIIRKGIARMARGYGISEDNIFYEPSETKPQRVVESDR